MLDAPLSSVPITSSSEPCLKLADLTSGRHGDHAPVLLPREALGRLREDLLGPALARHEGDVFLGARNIYTDRELFELEMKHLFEGGWVYAAHESQMPKPHDFMSFTVGRQPVLLTRDADGAVHGFYNACLHRGARVCREKVGNRKVHMCRFHGWCYNNRGELVNVTAEKDGAYPTGFNRKDFGLVPLPHVESYRGFIFVSLGADVISLKEFLGDAARFIDVLVDQSPTAELEVLSGETAYTYSGNWKLAAENGVDGYHVPTVHQNYLMTVAERAKTPTDGAPTKTFDISKWGQGEAGFFGFANGHALLYGPYFNYEDRPSYSQYDHYAQTLSPEHADWIVKRFRNLLLMPNVLLMDQMSSQIRLIRPISVDLTEVVTWCIAPKGEAPEQREKRIRQYEDFFNAAGMATPDDLAEFRNCQLGYAATGVPYSDLSRGQQRWVQGANETAQRFGIKPLLSSTQTSDEGVYVAILDQWRERMTQAVDRELKKAAS
ncbi:aromatic ring-hydroxylating dioxygenase subunit alpha [Nevskia sp.]|uniref:aromatic ring-hydroxylating oxygenase subunit alpha n=1 Tax=Nevskia sp. TaxID=1929292 RepID=UPI0025D7F489|nr:aromatic ring-hydroxylating dioxygenase subunit alpha [Nevskia sp.]